jgi:aspartate aminotransferase
MFRQSAALTRVAPSATLAISARAAELKRAGRDIISLSVGEPDFPVPDSAREAAIAAIRAGNNHYTAVEGTPELRAAVAEKFRRDNGLNYAANEVIVSVGGKQVIWNAMLATLDPGDEVIVPAPYWVSYPDMVMMAGGMPVTPMTTAADGYRLSPGELEAAITPRTRWLILNSPSNPTGAVYSDAQLRALAEVLERHPQVWVLSDDMYEHIRYTPGPFATMAAVAPALHERTLTVNGASKAFAMTGWRIGFAGGPRALIAAMGKAQSQSTSNPCAIAQAATLGALTGDQSFLAERCAAFRARRDRVVARVAAIPGLSLAPLDGAFYAYVGCEGIIGRRTRDGRVLADDAAVAGWLLDAGVAVVHGAAFGASPAFRISYATSPALLEAALDRIAGAVAGLEGA